MDARAKRGDQLGKIRGPRIWMSGQAIGGVGTGHDVPLARVTRGHIIVTTPEEVRRAVRRKKELGCDILKVNEFLSMDMLKIAVDEWGRRPGRGAGGRVGPKQVLDLTIQDSIKGIV